MAKRVSEEDKDQIVEMFDRARNTKYVAQALGLSRRTVQRALRERGVFRDSPKPKPAPHPQKELNLDPVEEAPKMPRRSVIQVTDDQLQMMEALIKHGMTSESLALALRRPEMSVENITATLATLSPEVVGQIIHNVSLTRIKNQIHQNQQSQSSTETH